MNYSTMHCPDCAGGIEFPAMGIGTVIRCPHCNRRVTLRAPEQRNQSSNEPPSISWKSLKETSFFALGSALLSLIPSVGTYIFRDIFSLTHFSWNGYFTIWAFFFLVLLIYSLRLNKFKAAAMGVTISTWISVVVTAFCVFVGLILLPLAGAFFELVFPKPIFEFYCALKASWTDYPTVGAFFVFFFICFLFLCPTDGLVRAMDYKYKHKPTVRPTKLDLGHSRSSIKDEPICCPKCRSTQILASKGEGGFGFGKAAAGGILLGPLGLAAGLLPTEGQVEITCLKCGHIFPPGTSSGNNS